VCPRHLAECVLRLSGKTGVVTSGDEVFDEILLIQQLGGIHLVGGRGYKIELCRKLKVPAGAETLFCWKAVAGRRGSLEHK